jgi:hypothetical protein
MSNIGKLSATDKVALLAMVGSMYRSSGGELSIIDLGTLGTGYADELRKVGFAQQPQGKGYMFLGPGETKAAARAKLQGDTAAVKTIIDKDKSLQSYLSKVNTQQELRDLVIAIFETFKPTFLQDKGKVDNALNKLDDRYVSVKEEVESADIQAIIRAIGNNSTLKGRLLTIDNETEAVEVILNVIVPYINPALVKDSTKVKQALTDAFNAIRNKKTTIEPVKWTTSSTQSKNTTATMPGNFKYEITEGEIQRFQKLAGIIK